jgi:hypothetical protein
LLDDYNHILTKRGETTFLFFCAKCHGHILSETSPYKKKNKTQVPQKFSTILFLHPSTMHGEQTSMQPLSLLGIKACVEESLRKT